MQERDFTTGDCDHGGSDYAPSYTHTNCTVCGAIKTDMDWGVASASWFDTLLDAKFYQQHGRLPERDKNGN